ncbi:MAG: hypothetical protein Q8N36_06665, partial [bacterium]|nr:hypothetical protein [bacterium]
MNQQESASLAALFQAANFEVVKFNTKSDVYLINSCVVTS